MNSSSRLTLSLIAFEGDLDALVKGAKLAQTARKALEPTTFENSFIHSTRTTQYLREASAYRYNKACLLREKKSLDENKPLARYRGLNFLIFCFLAPRLSAHYVASIPDEAWSGLVLWLSQHIWSQVGRVWKFESQDPGEAVTLSTFQRKAEEKLKAWDRDVAELFRKEWREEYPIWISCRNKLAEEVATLNSTFKKQIHDVIASRPGLDKVHKAELLKLIYTKRLNNLATQRIAELYLCDSQRNKYQIELNKTTARLSLELNTKLNAAVLHDGGLYKRLLDIAHVIEDYEQQHEHEVKTLLNQAAALAPEVLHQTGPSSEISTPSSSNYNSLPAHSTQDLQATPWKAEGRPAKRQAIDEISSCPTAQGKPVSTVSRSRGEIVMRWRVAMGLEELPRGWDLCQGKSTETLQVARSIEAPDFHKCCIYLPRVDLPARFMKLSVPTTSLCFALRKVLVKAQFRCIGSDGDAMPILLCPSGFGIQVCLTRSTPSLLLEWLRDTGERIKELRGYLLEGSQFCDYLEFWLCIKETGLEAKTSFQGILGETNAVVSLHRPYSEVLMAFDEHCFDLVAETAMSEAKASGTSLKSL